MRDRIQCLGVLGIDVLERRIVRRISKIVNSAEISVR